jgi:CRP/FNR family transcriptional regulator, cyclic AMP receptor protein
MAVVLLQRIPYLRNLPKPALQRLMRITRSRTFKKGEIIITQKEAGSHLFIVTSGKVKIFAASKGRKQKTHAVIGKGEFFGELALLDGTIRSASAQALEDSTLTLIPKRDFKKFLQRDPGFTTLLLRTMAERLRKANETIESLLFKNVLGRVAKALVDLNEKERRGESGPTVPIVMTQQELAEWVGTSREPLSRALSMLRRGGLISSEQGRIEIRDLPKLKQLVEA